MHVTNWGEEEGMGEGRGEIRGEKMGGGGELKRKVGDSGEEKGER